MKNSFKKLNCVIILLVLGFLSPISYAQCILSDNLTITPPPSGAVYNAGQVVNFCYHVTQYNQLNANWMLGIVPVFGSGWDMSTLTPGTAPVPLGTGGQWIWTSNVTSTATGLHVAGFGWYFDRGGDGNPGNNFGDHCSSQPNCSWDFCWSITTGTCPPNSTGASLNATINNYADGELGSWTSLNCQGDPNYQFSATLNCSSCSATAAITSSSQPGCGLSDGSATVAVTGGAANYNYVWENSSNITVSSTSGSASTSNTASNLPSDTYTVTITDANGCIATATIVLTAPNGLSAAISNSVQPTCTQTGSATVTVTGGTANFNYIWKNSSATVISSTPGTPNTTNTANNLPGSTYTVVITDALGCSDSATITLNQTSSTGATADAGIDQTICAGTTATLAGSINVTTAVGTWSGGTGTYNPDNITLTAVYTPSAAEVTAGTIMLILTPSDPSSSCPGVIDQMTITISQLPTADAGPVQSVCPGATISLNGTIGGAATSGTWSGGTGTYTPDSNTLNAVYTPSAAEFAADSVILTLTTDDPPGACSFSSSNVTFYFYQVPVVNFAIDTAAGCPGYCADFTNSTLIGGGDNITSWVWNFGDGSNGSTSSAPTHCFSQPGFYDINLIATSNHGCSSFLTQTQLVHVFPVPVAEFSADPNKATVIDPSITFNNQSSSDVNYWNWNFGDNDTLAPFTSSPVHTYPDSAAGSYWVTLIVQNTGGCFDTVKHEIFIGPGFTFFIPNAFTPNGNGTNDYFFGSGIGILNYEMSIFDRWGNMIFKTTELSGKWNGKANNDTVQMDVYVWKVLLTDVFNKKHNYIGTVTLVK